MRILLVLIAFCSSVIAASPDPRELAKQIDTHIDARLKAEKVPAAPQTDDAEFLRRAYLDLSGRIPSPHDVHEFLADKSTDKRAKLISELLQSPRYASHSAALWRAALAPETTAVPEARLFKNGFEVWLRSQFRKNVRYDAFVRELLTVPLSNDSANPTPALRKPDDSNPLAFYAVKEAKPENLAAATTRVFLGVQIECAQCHDHPFAKWSREQFWNQSAFFAGLEKTGEGMFAPISERLNVRDIQLADTKRRVPALFLDEAEPTGKELRSQLAEWITRKDNPYFARTAVNRVWGQMFGRGIVDPVDDFNNDNLPSHPELLNELAKAFADADFDLHYLIQAIAHTKAYQRSSRQTDPKQADPKLFARMDVKGLTGEQMYDSLIQATGYRETTGRFSARDQFLSRFAIGSKPETSIPQALMLMNGKFVADATTLESSPILTAACDLPGLNDGERIEMLYVSAMGRKPTEKELERTLKHLHDGGTGKRNERLADVFWALLNSAEFRLNH